MLSAQEQIGGSRRSPGYADEDSIEPSSKKNRIATAEKNRGRLENSRSRNECEDQDARTTVIDAFVDLDLWESRTPGNNAMKFGNLGQNCAHHKLAKALNESDTVIGEADTGKVETTGWGRSVLRVGDVGHFAKTNAENWGGDRHDCRGQDVFSNDRTRAGSLNNRAKSGS